MKRFFWLLFTLILSVPVQAQIITFAHGDNQLQGHYLAATDNLPTKAVLLFVHGDGEMPYDAKGFYELIWHPLREQGYAIFSWDKAGVGGSSGKWLNQSMKDRQEEVAAAIEAIQSRYPFSAHNTGLLGFSQAGWVVPALANASTNIGFAVGIGFATNWVQQGEYLTLTRMMQANASPSEIKQAIHAHREQIAFFDRSPSYQEYLQQAGNNPMSENRFQFVLKNYQADASQDFNNIQLPVLLLWGDSDLNVDASHELNLWQHRPNPNNHVETRMIANATHEMLRADLFNESGYGIGMWLKMMFLEEDALAPDFLPTLIKWLNVQTQPPSINKL
ncbi:alpha/beta hydrolase family protein [Litoribacillus peritrichatus]|uniref:CocE/NonD family hydrolase n=1 Tax=Litoribacillus peritrichatus TaxID=718191 RepID=A0ABP7MTC3_9GAMM